MKKIKILILILLLSGIVKAQLEEQNSIKYDNKEASRVATKSTTAINVYHKPTTFDALHGFKEGYIDWGDADNFTSKGNSSVRNTHKLNNLADRIYYSNVQSINNKNKAGAKSSEKTTVQANTQDSLALVALYNSTNGASWTNNANWLIGNVNTWYGVTVNSGRVTRLNLFSNNLNGKIPVEIGNLSELKYIDLRSDSLPNPLPSQIGSLLKLDTLYIAYSQITGTIPTSIGSLTNLDVLALEGNQLSGNIPIELGNLTQIKAIYLHDNRLTGTIPNQLGNLTNLTELYLGANQLSGTIPVELGNLANLTGLYLDYNQLSGSIPAELGNLANLTGLYLEQNQLSGTIPAELGNLTNLQELDLGINESSIKSYF